MHMAENPDLVSFNVIFSSFGWQTHAFTLGYQYKGVSPLSIALSTVGLWQLKLSFSRREWTFFIYTASG